MPPALTVDAQDPVHPAHSHLGPQTRLLMRVHMQALLAGDPTNLRLAKAILIPAMANRAIFMNSSTRQALMP